MTLAFCEQGPPLGCPLYKMRPPTGIGWLKQQRAYDIGWNRRVLTNLSPRCRSCPITFRTEVIPCSYTGTQRALLNVANFSPHGAASSADAPSCRSSLAIASACCARQLSSSRNFRISTFEQAYSLQHTQIREYRGHDHMLAAFALLLVAHGPNGFFPVHN